MVIFHSYVSLPEGRLSRLQNDIGMSSPAQHIGAARLPATVLWQTPHNYMNPNAAWVCLSHIERLLFNLVQSMGLDIKFSITECLSHCFTLNDRSISPSSSILFDPLRRFKPCHEVPSLHSAIVINPLQEPQQTSGRWSFKKLAETGLERRWME